MGSSKTVTSKTFEYKRKIIERTPADNNTLNTEVVVSFKYVSNFWRFLGLPLINYEIELDLPWSKNCIISEISTIPRIPASPDSNPPVQEVAARQTEATFQINNTKFYVSFVTLSINNNINFLENIKQGFKRTISWNRYRSEITT